MDEIFSIQKPFLFEKSEGPENQPVEKLAFMLDGCDIWFTAQAPADMTLRQLLKQCDRIRPNYCACGIRSLSEEEKEGTRIDLDFDYDDVKMSDPDIFCSILEPEDDA